MKDRWTNTGASSALVEGSEAADVVECVSQVNYSTDGCQGRW